MMLKLDKDIMFLVILTVLVGIFLFLNVKAESFDVEEPKNIMFDKSTNTLHLDSLTLKQKIAQMIFTYEKKSNKDILQKMLIGGIHLGAKSNKDKFISTINNFQDGAIVPFLMTIDLEGCWNPFENFQEFPTLREIETEEEAYNVGFEKGKLLSELGFGINFAPVLDLEDNIWNCRNFQGTPEEISEKANAYINGLQENGIIATSKHYPGKTIQVKDPHKEIIFAAVDENDLLPFEKTMENNVHAVMVSHIIVDGSLDSESKPAVVSKKLVKGLRNQFTGLIIADEIRMEGLSNYYFDIDEMYVDLFKADNDIILYFEKNPEILYRMISIVEDAVLSGELDEERIDRSVIKILEAKGINVK